MRRDYSAFWDDGTIEFAAPSKKFPKGKDYRVEMDAERGLWLSGLVESATLSSLGVTVPDEKLAELKLDDDEQVISFQKRVLGDTYDEMFADGVPWPLIRRIVTDIFTVFTQDETEADRLIEQSLADRGKAEAAVNRASRRAAKKASPKANSRARTGQNTAGSSSTPRSSGRADGDTPAPTRNRTSGRSSMSTPTTPEAATA